MVDWTPYLNSLCNAYTQWWKFGTLKDVVEPKRFEFGLMVQTVERDTQHRSGAGSTFREFTQLYERGSKDDAPVSDESRRWWSRLLEHLAFEMMQADKPTDFRLTISRREAEDILTKVLDREKFDKPRDRALEWLED